MQAMPFRHLERAVNVLLEGYRRGATIFIVGNGGSAATASHFACDLAKGTRIEGLPGFRVMPLTDNVPLITAWANDTRYDRIFAEQLTPHVQPGDILIAISASGNSANVLAAAVVARAAGAFVIGVTDQSGGKLNRLSPLASRDPRAHRRRRPDRAGRGCAHGHCA
jgi:D-sedoheptulose 7-phosphate isomerase